jgi:DNA-directed RNA polymerase specialized sigma24 family protein
MVNASQDITTFPLGDSRRLFYLRNYEWALKMTFRYLGEYEVAVATVHDTFLRLFRSMGQANLYGQTSDGRWVKEIFIKAAVNAALQGAALDTTPIRAGHAQTYLWELTGRDGEEAGPSKYRNAIAQLLLLPLYPRLAYNICIIEGCSGNEAARLLGITESQVTGHVQKARALLKNTMTN